jgi:hypothetical protein
MLGSKVKLLYHEKGQLRKTRESRYSEDLPTYIFPCPLAYDVGWGKDDIRELGRGFAN